MVGPSSAGDSKPSDADKTTKLYLCNAFLIRVRSCVKTELNDFRIGANRVLYADLTRD